MLAELKATTDSARFSDAPIARVYAALGDKDKAIKELSAGRGAYSLATYIKSDPPFEGLHSTGSGKSFSC